MKPIITNKFELRDIILAGKNPDVYDYSSITDMSGMFENCKSLTTIPHLDTSNVTNMTCMFDNCKSFTSIPHLDTASVTDMRSMFYDCKSLTSNVTNMYSMFNNCISLEEVFFHNLIDYSDINSPKLEANCPEFFI